MDRRVEGLLGGRWGRGWRAGAALAAALAAAALALWADRPAPPAEQARDGRGDRTLVVLFAGDVDSLDPGVTYYAPAWAVAGAVHRPLMSFPPGDASRAVPDLAAAPPRVSRDGSTVTVRIRPDVRFAPPTSRRVTARDVRYAIERGFFRTVRSPYATAHFGDLVGARADVPPGTRIAGLVTRGDHTLVLRLRRPVGGAVAAALALPLTAPVPPEVAGRHDRRPRSEYGAVAVATGPYRVVAHERGRRIRLERNPSWDAATDHRPARVPAIEIRLGNADTQVAARRVVRGRGLVSGDFAAPPGALREILASRRSQLVLVPSGAVSFVALNTAMPPFDDLRVRRAVLAGYDRRAAHRAAGGPLAGTPATHLIPPGVPGHEEAGRLGHAAAPLLADPRGDPRRARSALDAAGLRPERATGRERVVIVASTDSVGRAHGDIAQRSLERLGFRTRLRILTPEAIVGGGCARAHVCASFGFQRDVPDAQSLLDPLFHGRHVRSGAGANVSRLDVPAINAAMDAARVLADPAERAGAWARVDAAVMDRFAVIPLLWTRQPLLRSADVRGVVHRAHATWDLSHTDVR